MSLLVPKELVQARELMDQAKFDEALEIIEQFENSESLQAEDRLSASFLKQKIYNYNQQYGKSLEISDYAYQISQNLELEPESIRALIGKASIVFLGDFDKADAHIREAERRMKNISEDPSINILRRDLLLIKSWNLFLKLNLKGAAELAKECLNSTKEIGNNLDLANIYFLLGYINSFQEKSIALKYAMMSLELNQEFEHLVALAGNYSLIGFIYYREGKYDLALENCNKSLSIKEGDKSAKISALQTLSAIYYMKGKLNRTLKYLKQASELAEELKNPFQLIRILIELAYYNNILGNTDLAIELSERSINLSEKWGLIFFMAESLTQLIGIYLFKNSLDKANRYFSRLSELYNQTLDQGVVDISFYYFTSKAFLLSQSTRMRDRVEAQTSIKKVMNSPLIDEGGLIIGLGLLSYLLLEEFSVYNDPDILDELNPYISEMLNRAERVHNYNWLAQTKLLQGKLALIRMNIKEARKLMLEAQRVAELHGLKHLASRISVEHDKILEQEDLWDILEEKKASMAERIKLASIDNLLEHLQGRRAIEPPKLTHEIPVMILIIAEGGIPAFSYLFSQELSFEDDMISNFLSAFNSFSQELFSEGLDRARFGKFTLIMASVGPFSACYLFRGQSYLAREKLIQFVNNIQNTASIWRIFEDFYKHHQAIVLNENPPLKSLLTQIFIKEIDEISTKS